MDISLVDVLLSVNHILKKIIELSIKFQIEMYKKIKNKEFKQLSMRKIQIKNMKNHFLILIVNVFLTNLLILIKIGHVQPLRSLLSPISLIMCNFEKKKKKTLIS